MASFLWNEEEEKYLHILKDSCVSLSEHYHDIYFEKSKFQTRLRIPSIIIGSFSGVASFGSTTFPMGYQEWISITVGLVNVIIAITHTLESYFKLSEDMNASKSSSEQFRKLAEDIDREIFLPASTRQTSGIIFLRDAFTRYQQILTNSPLIPKYTSYLHKLKRHKVVKKISRILSTNNSLNSNSGFTNTNRNSTDSLNDSQGLNFNRKITHYQPSLTSIEEDKEDSIKSFNIDYIDFDANEKRISTIVKSKNNNDDKTYYISNNNSNYDNTLTQKEDIELGLKKLQNNAFIIKN